MIEVFWNIVRQAQFDCFLLESQVGGRQRIFNLLNCCCIFLVEVFQMIYILFVNIFDAKVVNDEVNMMGFVSYLKSPGILPMGMYPAFLRWHTSLPYAILPF